MADESKKTDDNPVAQIVQLAGVKSRNTLMTIALGVGGYAASFIKQTAEDIRQIRYDVAAFVESLKQVKEIQRDHETRLRYLEIDNIKKRRKN